MKLHQMQSKVLTKKPATVRSLQAKFQFNFETVLTILNLNLKKVYFLQVQVTAPTFTKEQEEGNKNSICSCT